MQNQLQLSVTSLGDRLDSTLCGLFVIPYHKTFTEKKFCPTTAYKTTLPGGCSSCLSLQACHNGVAFLRIISIIKLIFFSWQQNVSFYTLLSYTLCMLVLFLCITYYLGNLYLNQGNLNVVGNLAKSLDKYVGCNFCLKQYKNQEITYNNSVRQLCTSSFRKQI